MALKEIVTAPMSAVVGRVIVEPMEAVITDLEIRYAQENHALVEGARMGRPQTEREFIDRALRQAREQRYHAPDQYDFVDEFMFLIGDSYEHHPELFET